MKRYPTIQEAHEAAKREQSAVWSNGATVHYVAPVCRETYWDLSGRADAMAVQCVRSYEPIVLPDPAWYERGCWE